jgi:HK97 family phage prohead protease
MKCKEFNVKYADEGNGMIEGYASTWIRRPDAYGDVVKQGAFKNTLEQRWNGGKGIPLLWAHQMNELSSYIGKADAEEDEKGLHFVATFDDTEEAQRVRDLYKDGRLSKFSFAFDIKEEGITTLEDGTKANELKELDLFEISCVCVPANDDAGVVSVKAEEPDVKSGKRNSAKDADAIRQAITLLQGVLGELDEVDDTDDGEDDVKANAAAEEQKQSNPAKESLLAYINKNKQEVES